MRSYCRFLAIVCTILIGNLSRADILPVSGSDRHEFRAAVESWLDGDDLVALEALASLSQDGNPAAQILLSGIAARGSLHSHVTSDLSRADRIALLRVPGGLSGKSWLTVAENTEPLATALLQVTQIGEKAPAISALISLGETQDALIAAQSMLLQGKADELIDVLEGMDADLPPEADVILLWALFQAASEDSGRYMGSARVGTRVLDDQRFEASEMVWVPPTPTGILEDSDRRDDVIRLGPQIESWTPVRNFCDRHCSEGTSTCTGVGVALLSAVGPFPMRSPRMSIISNEDYWKSARVDADLARNIIDLRRYPEGTFDSIDSCFMKSMSALQAEYGHRE